MQLLFLFAVQCKNHHLAKFLGRPNRFLAYVELPSGEVVKAHVPDPGRLKELLVPNAEVLIRRHSLNKSSQRKTAYSLIGVKTGDVWVNIESQLSNKLFARDFSNFNVLTQYRIVRSEYPWHSSRFDFLLEHKFSGRHALVEIKSVTLVENSVALFPDAPTVRGAKHVRELHEAINSGMDAFLVFLVKRDDAEIVSLNYRRDPTFYRVTKDALKNGLKPLALQYRYDTEYCPRLIFCKSLEFNLFKSKI